MQKVLIKTVYLVRSIEMKQKTKKKKETEKEKKDREFIEKLKSLGWRSNTDERWR